MGRKIIGIYFNDKTESQLLRFVQQQENFSAWVKDRIREKIDPRQLISPELQRLLEEMIKKQITIYDFVPKQDAGLKNDLEDYF